MVATFATDGQKLSGTLESDQGAMDFEGTIAGTVLKWDMKVTKPMSVTLKYELNVAGDTLSGKVKMGFFGTSKVSGERLG